jgi:hypothetical protein
VKINRDLNLVIPVERGDDIKLYVYSIPVATFVFERYYMVFARAFNRIYTDGLGIMSGPRVAAFILRDVAREMGAWDGPEGAERGLMAEMRRLTSVIVLDDKGWCPIPLHEAVARSFLDERDVSEVENALVFFTLAWHMHRRADREAILASGMKLWSGQLEWLSLSEFCSSLPTSIEIGTSQVGGVTTPASSVPS